MSQQTGGRIVDDGDQEPHIRGTRVTVRKVHDALDERDSLDPEGFAREFDVELADVYAALLWVEEHPDRLEEVRQERQRTIQQAKDRTEHLRPDSDD
jgi:uncharacterized protein (DUF433 family)